MSLSDTYVHSSLCCAPCPTSETYVSKKSRSRVGITVDATGSMERIQYGTQARQHHFGAKKNQSGTRAASFWTRTSTWNTGGVFSARSRMTLSRVPKRRALVLGKERIRLGYLGWVAWPSKSPVEIPQVWWPLKQEPG